jgi:hypothetical protein
MSIPIIIDILFYFIFVKENVCKAVKNRFFLHEISHIFHIFTLPCCNVDKQNDLSYVIQCIDMLTVLFSDQIYGVIICNHESES